MRCKSTGKIRHYSKRAAMKALATVGDPTMTAYRCPACGGWHNGHTEWGRQQHLGLMIAKGLPS